MLESSSVKLQSAVSELAAARAAIAFGALYGKQVAKELRLIESVLQRVAQAGKIELNEADLDGFCRRRQVKLNVHAQQTADEDFERVRLLNMLYEGCLDFLSNAIGDYESGSDEAAAAHIDRAIQILKHLSETLDHKQGGSIAADLERLYDFSVAHLQQSRAKNSGEMILTVRGVIEKIYLGYLELEIQQDAAAYLNDRTQSHGLLG